MDLLEADLQRVYGIDLRDLWLGGLSWRRLIVLVRHLPGDSLVVSRQWSKLPPTVEIPDPEFRRLWTTDQELLASVVDAVTHLTTVVVQANSKKGRAPRWSPLPRPAEKEIVRRVEPGKLEHIRRRNRVGKVVRNGH